MRRSLGILSLATTTLACGSCGSSASPPAAPSCGAYDALVVASDYSVASAVGAFDAMGKGTMTGGVDLGADPALTVSAGRAFFVARDLDVVLELDPKCGAPRAGKRFSTRDPARPSSTNPQDVAVAPDGALFVPRFDEPSILVLDASGAQAGTIDLSALDGDGNPNASSIRIANVGGAAKAFVTLERLDDGDLLKSKQPSWVAVVDVATRAVESHVELQGRNPFGLIVEAAGAFYFAEPGNFDAADEPLAGIERFSPESHESALLVHEKDLGGSVAEVAIADDGGCGVAIVADATPRVNRTSLVAFDPSSGAVLAPAAAALIGPTENFDLSGLAWKGRVLFVGDRRGDSGYRVHVFDRTAACTLTERPDVIALPQKPVALRAIN